MTADILIDRELVQGGRTSVTLADVWNLAAILWWQRYRRPLVDVLVDRLLFGAAPIGEERT